MYNMLPVCVNMFVSLFFSLLSFPLLSSAYMSDYSCANERSEAYVQALFMQFTRKVCQAVM